MVTLLVALAITAFDARVAGFYVDVKKMEITPKQLGRLVEIIDMTYENITGLDEAREWRQTHLTILQWTPNLRNENGQLLNGSCALYMSGGALAARINLRAGVKPRSEMFCTLAHEMLHLLIQIHTGNVWVIPEEWFDTSHTLPGGRIVKGASAKSLVAAACRSLVFFEDWIIGDE